MGNLVVVAIPAQDERVWKVSSEKVPHLTLLFLGDADSNPNTERITEFVDHAVTVCEHGPFMLDVDYRGVLGPDEADVLFFRKGWSAKWIEQFRNSLLQNTDIRAAYESTDQFPEWQPHLTLGYPTTPANEDDSEHGIRWVSFDRIAVWTGDYAGAEFRLEWPEMDYGGALAYSQETRLGMQFLEHHGVKGMKWGQRKEQLKRGARAIGRGIGKATVAIADASWEGHARSPETFKSIQATAHANLHAENGPMDRLKASPKYYGKNLKADSDLRKTYYEDVAKVTEKAYKSATKDHLGTNFSDTRKAIFVDDANGPRIEIVNKVATHADGSVLPTIIVKLILDSNGFVKDSSAEIEASMAQTAELGAEFLAHHGIKGMHWGHRKEQVQQRLHAQRVVAEAAKRAQRPAQDVRAYPTIGPSKHKPGNIATKGGEDHPPTKDAIKVAEARQKIKKSGLHALTNDELRDVATRLNLEQQVVTLEGKRGKQKSLGRKFIEGVLNDKGTQKKASEFVFNQVSKKTG